MPLSIISVPEPPELVIIVGIPGWEPQHIPLNQLEAGGAIQVVSNGIMYSLDGEPLNGEIVGIFQNAVTRESGEWKLIPVRKAQ